MKKHHLAIVTACILSLFAFTLVACGGEDATTTTAAPGETGTTAAPSTNTTAPAEKITLKYAYFAPEANFPGRQMMWWAEEVSKRTNGQVEVQTFPGGTLLTAKNMYDGVLQGVADIGLSFVTYEPGRFPLLSIHDLPGLYPGGNATQASNAFFDVVWANQDIAELADFKVITAFSTEPAYIMSIDKYDTLASLNGAEIRTPGGPKILEALGGVGVGMPQSEVSQALQTGVIKGLMSSREVLQDFKYAEKCKFVMDKPLGQVSALVVMSKARWDELPDNVKQVIEELAPEAAAYAGDVLDTSVQSSLDWSTSTQGVSVVAVSAEESAKMDEALAPLVDEWVGGVNGKGLPGTEFLAKYREAATKFAQ
ncbi:MAG: TRAP transporter substrate-binding protein [Thermoleophilia bacterium]